ncbi:hypothetical protein U0F71_06655 [Burkholderia pseudomallei]|uniref:hypothetical protein n=1 Tax=Burkholderia pseudomallei TaxID=28450 RepID=UPI002AB47CAD|nr:hypothetical protein [Burkholderia pseudomallei]MDY7815394.1 hypothetical protein [Burkholderia pseudomallei]MDY7862045.1 hypothetical protein [Burkholderia pseudomallei]
MNLTCPHCGAHNDRHSAVTERGEPPTAPSDGAVSICISCGELAIFDMHERCLRLPTIDEANDLESHPVLMLCRAAWRAMKNDNSH